MTEWATRSMEVRALGEMDCASTEVDRQRGACSWCNGCVLSRTSLRGHGVVLLREYTAMYGRDAGCVSRAFSSLLAQGAVAGHGVL